MTAEAENDLEHRFSVLQTAVYRAGFPQAVERVSLRIAWRQGEGWCFLTVEQISSDCAVSLATAKRALAVLERKGWMEVCAGEKTGRSGRPTKGRRIVVPSAEAHPEPKPVGVTAQGDEPKSRQGPAAVSARDAEPKVAEFSAQGSEPKPRVSAHGAAGGFGSSEGGVSAHPKGGFGSAMGEPPHSHVNSQLPPARPREAEPKPSPAGATPTSNSPNPREGWRERALQALWAGWQRRHAERFPGTKPHLDRLNELHACAAWTLQHLRSRDGTPEDVAERLLTGFWLRKDIRRTTPASWMCEKGKAEKYMRAGEQAFVDVDAEQRRSAARALEDRRLAEKWRADDAEVCDNGGFVGREVLRTLRGETIPKHKHLPTQLAAFRADHRSVLARVEDALPDPTALLDADDRAQLAEANPEPCGTLSTQGGRHAQSR